MPQRPDVAVPDFARWYAGKNFTSDWTSGNFEVWANLLAPLRHGACDVLEIGSWEGRSAIFFLEFLPECRLTCIDTFGGGQEHAHLADVVARTEERFDANLAGYGGRVEKIKSRSLPALDKLAREGRMFDLVYVDGSHQRDDVMIDSLLAYRMLKPQGFMIWDDYRWRTDSLPAAERPQQAIDAFLVMHRSEVTIRHLKAQAVIQKIAGNAASESSGLRIARTPRNLLHFLRGWPLCDFR